MNTNKTRNTHSDDGSALILVLVLIVVGSLIVLPLMDYAMSIGRANTVLTTKTKRTEAVKAALRIAMAKPTRLYDTCGGGGDVALAVDVLDVDVSAVCRLIATNTALDDTEKRVGLAAVQVGETVPAQLLATGTAEPPPAAYAPPSGPESAWQADATSQSLTGKLWMPNLPVLAASIRTASDGWPMPSPSTCTAYFPGTYPGEITIDGPTYFASGIYYFENVVTITNGADVVVGSGNVQGCTNDQDAAFQAAAAPPKHHIDGNGGTFVFGKAGRLVVNNAGTLPIRLRFNYRYVKAGDLGGGPSAGVSILSVNGALEADGTTGKALHIDGKLDVPLSLVGSDPGAVPATTKKYVPSTLVPAMPTAPDPPITVTATPHKAAARVSWVAPANAGHSQITEYTVEVSSGPAGPSCTTVGLNTCVVTGLTNDTAYQFTVKATNAVGSSVASTPSPSVTPTAASPDPTPQATDPGPAALPPEAVTPIIDIDLTGTAAVEVHVPGHISIPQGRFREWNPGTAGLDVRIDGGVLAASFDVQDLRPAPIPVGLVNAVIQRKIQIVTQTTPASGAPHVVSTAVFQINQSGAWKINSWVVQAN